jgi:hypothetical protein
VVVLAVGLALLPVWAQALDRAAAERDLVTLTNGDRTSNGLASLRPNDSLTAIARERSQDMATRNYFSHEIPPDNHYFEDLLSRDGINYRMAGENIARNNFGDSDTTQRAQTGFLNSPPHRANILEPAYRDIGVGAWDRSDGMKYFTVLFMLAAGDSAQGPSTTALARRDGRADDASAPPRWLQALLGPARAAQAQGAPPPLDQTDEVPPAASARRVQNGPPPEQPPALHAPPPTAEVVAAQPVPLGLIDGIITRVLKLYLSM